MLLPFESVYDDYGGGENSDPIVSNAVFDLLRPLITEMELGRNEYHDIPVKRADFGEKLFYEAIHEHRLFIKGSYAEEAEEGGFRFTERDTPIDFVMFRKDIVDSILEGWALESYLGEGKGNAGWGKSYVYYTFNDVIADLPALMARLDEKRAEHEASVPKRDGIALSALKREDVPDLTDEQFKTLVRRLARHRLRGASSWLPEIAEEYKANWEQPNGSLAARWLRTHGGASCDSLLEEDIMELVIETKDVKLAESAIRGKLLVAYMETARKNWAPAGHEGSQTQERDVYKLLIEAMGKFLEEEAAEAEEWEDEMDEDE